MPEKNNKLKSLRIAIHPVTGGIGEYQRKINIFVDHQPLEVLEGETLVAALWANGLIAVGQNSGADFPRGMYCGIGHCYECRVTVDGIEDIRSCLIPVREGMQVILRDPEPVKGDRHGG